MTHNDLIDTITIILKRTAESENAVGVFAMVLLPNGHIEAQFATTGSALEIFGAIDAARLLMMQEQKTSGRTKIIMPEPN